MKLILVRHGQTIENLNGIIQGQTPGTLTELGHQQAEKVAEKLKSRDFDIIYCSDLGRCLETAKHIRVHHPDTPFETTDQIREISFGDIQGKLAADIDWASIGGHFYTNRPGGGETLQELEKRVLKFISKLYAKHPNDTVLLVTHGGPIRATNRYFTKGPVEDLLDWPIQNTMVVEYDVNEPLKIEE